MVKKVQRSFKGELTAVRLNIPSELWRKFRAGCIYMDKDVNNELNRLIDSWVKEWHKRISKSGIAYNEPSDISQSDADQSSFSASVKDHEGGGSV